MPQIAPRGAQPDKKIRRVSFIQPLFDAEGVDLLRGAPPANVSRDFPST